MERIDGFVRARLARALHAAGLADERAVSPESLKLELLEGGLGRRSYLVYADERAWVIRAPADGRCGVLDLGAEAEITADAALLGLGPGVAAVDAGTGVLITEHLTGAREMTAEALRAPENIDRVAALLRQLHTIRRGLRRFDPEDFAAQYLAGFGAEGALTGTQRRYAEELRGLAQRYRTRYPSIVLCHNDLVASNILEVGGGLRLVDFEYAVTAAPILDLAGLAAMNDFDGDARWRLAEAYYEGSAVPFTPAELAGVERLVRLIAYFWALSCAAAASDREPYEHFAVRTASALER